MNQGLILNWSRDVIRKSLRGSQSSVTLQQSQGFRAWLHADRHDRRYTIARSIPAIRTAWVYRNPGSSTRSQARRMSWVARFRGQAQEPFDNLSDGQDEAARAAIMEKVMQGRQPTDLMLRCKVSPLIQTFLSLYSYFCIEGTVIDSEGSPSSTPSCTFRIDVLIPVFR